MFIELMKRRAYLQFPFSLIEANPKSIPKTLAELNLLVIETRFSFRNQTLTYLVIGEKLEELEEGANPPILEIEVKNGKIKLEK